MQIVRDSKGVVSVDGEQICSVPSNFTMLIVLGNNSVAHGDEFRDDFKVYHNGVPYRRWFIEVENLRIWPPHLNEVARIEKAMLWAKRRRERAWAALSQAMQNTKRETTYYGKRRFRLEDDRKSISWAWTNELRFSVGGHLLYMMDKRWWKACSIEGDIGRMFYEAIQKQFPVPPNDKYQPIQIAVINGHRYAFQFINNDWRPIDIMPDVVFKDDP